MEAMKMIQDGRQEDFPSLLPYHFDYCKGAIDNPDVVSRIKVPLALAWLLICVLTVSAYHPSQKMQHAHQHAAQ